MSQKKKKKNVKKSNRERTKNIQVHIARPFGTLIICVYDMYNIIIVRRQRRAR